MDHPAVEDTAAQDVSAVRQVNDAAVVHGRTECRPAAGNAESSGRGAAADRAGQEQTAVQDVHVAVLADSRAQGGRAGVDRGVSAVQDESLERIAGKGHVRPVGDIDVAAVFHDVGHGGSGLNGERRARLNAEIAGGSALIDLENGPGDHVRADRGPAGHHIKRAARVDLGFHSGPAAGDAESAVRRTAVDDRFGRDPAVAQAQDAVLAYGRF